MVGKKTVEPYNTYVLRRLQKKKHTSCPNTEERAWEKWSKQSPKISLEICHDAWISTQIVHMFTSIPGVSWSNFDLSIFFQMGWWFNHRSVTDLRVPRRALSSGFFAFKKRIFKISGSTKGGRSIVERWVAWIGCWEVSEQMDVSENSGTPKSSILIVFSVINHIFWGTPFFGNPQITWVNHHEFHHHFLGDVF